MPEPRADSRKSATDGFSKGWSARAVVPPSSCVSCASNRVTRKPAAATASLNLAYAACRPMSTS
eukprot:scaffold1649_cov134-Isochrysis_galbana.AAC.4